MRAYGTDHLKREGERILLSSRTPKGWQGRIARTYTSVEHPGTAILWDDACYEVLDVESLPQGYRYTLAPWDDTHAMRFTDRYDEATEVERVAEHRRKIARERQRKFANLFGIFTGHLPAEIQNHLGSELGVLPVKLTLISIVGTFLLIAGTILYTVHLRMQFRPPPFWAGFVIYYCGAEMTFRLAISLFQNRPIGTVLGVIVSWFVPRRFFDRIKGNAVPKTVVPEDAQLRDLFATREPLVTLLNVEEQERVAQRFDYDYRRHSTGVAFVLLLFAILGVLTSFRTLGRDLRPSAFASLMTAAAVSGEQIYRLLVLRTRPVGSFLSILARPFLRRLL